nr:hypothetical protein [Tanacetum cinerariifolium]
GDRGVRAGGQPRAQIGQLDAPGRRQRIGDDHQRPMLGLRLVPGMEQLLLGHALGIVDDGAATFGGEDTREQAAPRLARA